MTNNLRVQAFFDPRDEWPYVLLEWGENHAQMTVEDAGQLARQIMACAVAAEQDAFLMDFLSERLGHSKAQVGQLLGEFAAWRQSQEERTSGNRTA